MSGIIACLPALVRQTRHMAFTGDPNRSRTLCPCGFDNGAVILSNQRRTSRGERDRKRHEADEASEDRNVNTAVRVRPFVPFRRTDRQFVPFRSVCPTALRATAAASLCLPSTNHTDRPTDHPAPSLSHLVVVLMLCGIYTL